MNAGFMILNSLYITKGCSVLLWQMEHPLALFNKGRGKFFNEKRIDIFLY